MRLKDNEDRTNTRLVFAYISAISVSLAVLILIAFRLITASEPPVHHEGFKSLKFLVFILSVYFLTSGGYGIRHRRSHVGLYLNATDKVVFIISCIKTAMGIILLILWFAG